MQYVKYAHSLSTADVRVRETKLKATMFKIREMILHIVGVSNL